MDIREVRAFEVTSHASEDLGKFFLGYGIPDTIVFYLSQHNITGSTKNASNLSRSFNSFLMVVVQARSIKFSFADQAKPPLFLG
jgi:hypothetical protein